MNRNLVWQWITTKLISFLVQAWSLESEDWCKKNQNKIKILLPTSVFILSTINDYKTMSWKFGDKQSKPMKKFNSFRQKGKYWCQWELFLQRSGIEFFPVEWTRRYRISLEYNTLEDNIYNTVAQSIHQTGFSSDWPCDLQHRIRVYIQFGF